MRPVSDWHSAIAHIDADGFYAACELVRHPELAGRPVCVLSNHNAFVVAKNYEAKARGITTCMPLQEAKKRVPEGSFLPPDFRYYGQVSEKLFSVLRRFSPEIEVYSIDEGFMDLNGLRTLWHKGFRQIADDIRCCVQRDIGITVSVGVANTKTLAKIASERNKPNGTTVVPGRRIDRFLADIPVQDIPGIGNSRSALLGKFGMRTARDLTHAHEGLIRRLLGRHGLTLWYELNGQPVLPLQLTPPLPKSVARTASLGRISTERGVLAAHLAHHATQLTSELVAKGLLARRISVFLTLSSFETMGMDIGLGHPTNSLKRLSDAVRQAFCALHREGVPYRGCGVVATHLSRAAAATEDLFGCMREDTRQARLMLAVNAINRKYGRNTLHTLADTTRSSTAPRFNYPLLMAR